MQSKIFIAAAVCLFFSCKNGTQQNLDTRLHMEPSVALAGDQQVSINLSAENIEFDKCDELTLESLFFTSPGGQSQITVNQLVLLSSQYLLAQITVDAQAETGSHKATIVCDRKTSVNGYFEVKPAESALDITINPAAGPAGTRLDITITSDNGGFVNGLTHVEVGDSSLITIEEPEVVSQNQINASMSISPLAPVAVYDVHVITGAKVKRGKFDVTFQIPAKISVIPDNFTRPASETKEISLVIESQGIVFPYTTGDAGVFDTFDIVVSFPYNPGITVVSTVVEDSNHLRVDILLDSIALTGPTALFVNYEEFSAKTAVFVDFDESAFAVYPEPALLERGCSHCHVVLSAVNFSFENIIDVGFRESGCQVNSWEIIESGPSSDRMNLFVKVDNDFPLGENTLIVELSDREVECRIIIAETVKAHLTYWPAFIEQGQELSVSVFSSAQNFDKNNLDVQITSGSGLSMPIDPQAGDDVMALPLRSCADAPVGPAKISVNTTGGTESFYFSTEPSKAASYLTVIPQVVLPGYGPNILSITSHGVNLSPDAGVELDFNIPEIELLDSVQIIEPDIVKAEVLINPSTDNNIAVVYLSSNQQKAAGSFRIDVHEKPFAQIIGNHRLTRQDETQTLIMPVIIKNMAVDDSITADFPENSGLSVRSLEFMSYFGDLLVNVYVDIESEGSGGWTGLLFSTLNGKAAVPVFVESNEDNSLTAIVEAAPEIPGASISLYRISHASLSGVIKFPYMAFPAMEGTVAKIFRIDEINQTVDVSLEIPVNTDLEDYPQYADYGIPVIAALKKGAVVGFVPYTPYRQLAADAGLPENDAGTSDAGCSNCRNWEGTVNAGEQKVILPLDSQPYPVLVKSSSGRPFYADAGVTFFSDDGLYQQSEMTVSRELWKTGESGGFVSIAPEDAQVDALCAIHMRYFGDESMQMKESDNDTYILWKSRQLNTVQADPCEKPYFKIGYMDSGDMDFIELPPTGCRLMFDIIARRLTQNSWTTPDTSCQLCYNCENKIFITGSSYWSDSSFGDSGFYFDSDENQRQAAILGEMGTVGTYMVNIRRPVTIKKICRTVENPYIELEVEKGTFLTSLKLSLRNKIGEFQAYSLSAYPFETDDNTILVATGDSTLDDVDIKSAVAELPATTPFAVILLDEDEIIDAVQVGMNQDFGEGKGLPNVQNSCFRRIQGIDTNDNNFDFITVWDTNPE